MKKEKIGGKPKTINFSPLVSVSFSQENTGHVLYKADMYSVAEKKHKV